MHVTDLYPFFEHGTELIIQPIGGIICKPIDPDNLLLSSTVQLNQLATYVAANCNGHQSVESILNNVEFNFTGKEFNSAESASKLISDMGRMGILRFSDTPQYYNSLDVKGSAEYFTPLHFSIEMTNHCNLNCKHCYNDSGPARKQFLPTEKTKLLFEILAENGVRTIELTGGEPLTHPGFFSILKKAITEFERVAIITNGTLIDQKFIDLIREYSKKIIVQIDLDGDTSGIHDALRGKVGAFRKACRAAAMLKECGIFFRVVMNVHSGNLDRVNQTALLAKELGASVFSFAPIVEVGRASAIELLSNYTQVEEFLSLVRNLEEMYPDFIKVSAEFPRNEHSAENCGGGWRTLTMGPTGNIRPCNMLSEDEGSFGNLFDEDYEDLLQRIPSIYHYHLKTPSDETCKECNSNFFCRGCFTRPFHANNKELLIDSSFVCHWNEFTSYFDMMKSYSSRS